MTKDLQEKLFNKYPKLFTQKDLSIQQSPMAWGITCGDGWYRILNVLCNRITKYIKSNKNVVLEANDTWEDNDPENPVQNDPENPVQFVQIKEKFGTLRVYINWGDTTIYELIALAEEMSSVTCEECGAPGELYTGGWYKTCCSIHKSKSEF